MKNSSFSSDSSPSCSIDRPPNEREALRRLADCSFIVGRGRIGKKRRREREIPSLHYQLHTCSIAVQRKKERQTERQVGR